MKSSMLVVLCIALAMYGAAGRSLTDAYAKNDYRADGDAKGSDTGSSAYIKGTVQSNGGLVEATGVASAKAIAISETAVAKSVSYAIHKVKEGYPADAQAQSVAVSIAQAVAKAFAKAYISIRSTGEDNKACVVAKADAYAVAKAVAKAVARAVAIAAQEHGYKKAIADMEATAIAEKTAFAYAKAQSVGCLHGKGNIVAVQESFGASYVAVYAKAIAGSIAKISHDGYAASKAYGKAESDDKEKAFAYTKGASGVNIDDGSGFADAKGFAFGKIFDDGKKDECDMDITDKCCDKKDCRVCKYRYGRYECAWFKNIGDKIYTDDHKFVCDCPY